MKNVYDIYNTFISSPGDVEIERLLAEEVIESINKRVIDTLNVYLAVKKWEDRSPVTTHIPDHRLQEEINKEVRKANFFILILNKRYGSTESGQSKSNTEREIDAILQKFKDNPQIKIFAYFKEIPENKDPGKQEQMVIELRKRLSDAGISYYKYRDESDFKVRFIYDIFDVLMKMKLSSFKSEMLKIFWQFGLDGQKTGPKAYILYPPVPRDLIADGNKKYFWTERLASTIYFEDYKAIDKITKTFMSIKFFDWQLGSVLDSIDWSSNNRIWLCLPRNNVGKSQLQKHRCKSRFSIVNNDNEKHCRIEWKNDSGNTIEVTSPLSSYLHLQRSRMNVKSDWRPEFGRIIAKDYAIVARFENNEFDDNEKENLYDYFIFGIRGLGTWGAAWFIDRRYKQFSYIEDKKDIQYLLEVRFLDNKIVDVVPVSDKEQDYFDLENDISNIQKNIDIKTFNL